MSPLRCLGVLAMSALSALFVEGCLYVEIFEPLAEPPADAGAPPMDAPTVVVEAGADAPASLADAMVGPCGPTAAFGLPQEVTELNTAPSQGGARLSPDMLTVFYHAVTVLHGPRYLFEASRTRTVDPFTPKAASPVPATIGAYPTAAPNGLALYFESTRSGPVQIWYVTRPTTNDLFGSPAAVAGITDPLNTGQPYLAAPGDMYFVSRHAGGLGSTDYYRSTITSPGVATGFVAVPELSTGGGDSYPVVTPDGLRAFYGRLELADGSPSATTRIWSASRATTSEPFGGLRPETSLWSGNGNHRPTWISADACTIYYSSDGGNGDDADKIYVARRASSN